MRLEDAVDWLERATDWLLGSQHNDLDTALAGATPYLRLFALAAGGALLAEEALAASGSPEMAPMRPRAPRSRASSPKISRCRPGALERTVIEGADSVNHADAALG